MSVREGPATRPDVRPYLRPEERVLWSGGPDPAKRFGLSDAFLIPFSLMFLAFSIFWETAAVSGQAPVFFYLWGIPFIGIGLFMTAGRFPLKARRKRRTAYALTTQRAIIVTGSREIRDSPLANLPTTVSRSRDGHATVVFGTDGGRFNPTAMYANSGIEGFPSFGRGGAMPFAFYDVANPEAMLQALDNLRAGTGTAPGQDASSSTQAP